MSDSFIGIDLHPDYMWSLLIIDKCYRLLQNPIVSPGIASILEYERGRKAIITICDDQDLQKT